MNPDPGRTPTATLEPETLEFYTRVIKLLAGARVPVLLGGAYAFQCYTGIARHTKDLDLFLAPESVQPALRVLSRAGFAGGMKFEHWLAKAWDGDNFVDLIFSSGNGIGRVDAAWFKHAVDGRIADVEVKLCPAEEMIWSKAFVMERERFDGADVAHLLNARGNDLDWPRLVDRFGDAHWRLLFTHLVLFGYIYPSERGRIPGRVMSGFLARLNAEDLEIGRAEEAAERICRGTFLSRAQYLVDIENWGFRDPRLEPDGGMTAEQVEAWTKGIAEDGPLSRPIAAPASDSSGCAGPGDA